MVVAFITSFGESFKNSLHPDIWIVHCIIGYHWRVLRIQQDDLHKFSQIFWSILKRFTVITHFKMMNISFSIMSLLVHSENIYPLLNNIHLSFNQALSVPLHFFLLIQSAIFCCARGQYKFCTLVWLKANGWKRGGMVSLKHMKSVPASVHLMF